MCSNFSIINENGYEIDIAHKKPNYIPENLFENILTYNYIVHSPTVLLRKNIYDTVGLYPLDIIQEDYYMWLVLAKNFKFGYIYDITVKYRVLANSLSRNPETIYRLKEDALKVIKRLYEKDNTNIELFIEAQAKLFEDIYNSVYNQHKNIDYLLETIEKFSVLSIIEHITNSKTCLKLLTRSLYRNFSNSMYLLKKHNIYKPKLIFKIFSIRNIKRSFLN